MLKKILKNKIIIALLVIAFCFYIFAILPRQVAKFQHLSRINSYTDEDYVYVWGIHKNELRLNQTDLKFITKILKESKITFNEWSRTNYTNSPILMIINFPNIVDDISISGEYFFYCEGDRGSRYSFKLDKEDYLLLEEYLKSLE